MAKRKLLKIDLFLSEMDQVIPWSRLCDIITPYYYGATKTGLRRYDTLLMLKIYCLQQWQNLSDPGVEEAIYDRSSFQRFLERDIFSLQIPDETSILNFRHLLEKHRLDQQILSEVNAYLDEQGLVMKEGTVVDATLLPAPVSKKNTNKERDPEMSSTKKNNKWYFGAKGHIGVQAEGKPIIHSVDYTTAKQHDIKSMDKLFHGEEKAIFGDSAYNSNDDKREKRAENVYYGISDKGTRRRCLSTKQKKKNRKHSSIRAKVEHPFRIIKPLWGHAKLRYKGLMKNAVQFTTLCALQNIYVCRKELIATG